MISQAYHILFGACDSMSGFLMVTDARNPADCEISARRARDISAAEQRRKIGNDSAKVKGEDLQ